MKSSCIPLRQVTAITAALLIAGAILAVGGIFDECLNGHIIGDVIHAVMLSVWVLGGFGVALTVVLGIWEMITIFRKSAAESYPDKAVRVE